MRVRVQGRQRVLEQQQELVQRQVREQRLRRRSQELP